MPGTTTTALHAALRAPGFMTLDFHGFQGTTVRPISCPVYGEPARRPSRRPSSVFEAGLRTVLVSLQSWTRQRFRNQADAFVLFTFNLFDKM
jgi:hypothetical protein